MTAATAAIDLDPIASRKAADAEYFRRVLVRLVEVSAAMVEMDFDQARAQAAYTAETGATVWPAPDRTVAIDRMARCIRRTISLAQRLDEPPRVQTDLRDERRAAARTQIVRGVEASIERQAGEDEGKADALLDGLRERMDAPESDDDIDGRPVGEIIADICRSLGLGTPPGLLAANRRTPEDVATLWTGADPDAWDVATDPSTRPAVDAWPGRVGDGASVLLSEGRFRGK